MISEQLEALSSMARLALKRFSFVTLPLYFQLCRWQMNLHSPNVNSITRRILSHLLQYRPLVSSSGGACLLHMFLPGLGFKMQNNVDEQKSWHNPQWIIDCFTSVISDGRDMSIGPGALACSVRLQICNYTYMCSHTQKLSVRFVSRALFYKTDSETAPRG